MEYDLLDELVLVLVVEHEDHDVALADLLLVVHDFLELLCWNLCENDKLEVFALADC